MPADAYDHESPARALGGWMELLKRAFRPEDTRLTYKAFDCKEGQFVLSPLPELEAGVQSELYLLVRSEDPSQPPSLEGVKVASPSRLPRGAPPGAPGHPLPARAAPGLPPRASARRSPGTSCR